MACKVFFCIPAAAGLGYIMAKGSRCRVEGAFGTEDCDPTVYCVFRVMCLWHSLQRRGCLKVDRR